MELNSFTDLKQADDNKGISHKSTDIQVALPESIQIHVAEQPKAYKCFWGLDCSAQWVTYSGTKQRSTIFCHGVERALDHFKLIKVAGINGVFNQGESSALSEFLHQRDFRYNKYDKNQSTFSLHGDLETAC